MNILFIYPDIMGYSLFKGNYYNGLASLSAAIKEKTPHRVELLHLKKAIKKEDFLLKIEEADTDLVAFTSTANMFGFVRQWSNWVKEYNKDLKTICGGAHATICPEEVINNSGIDMVCVGEGEDSLLELSDKLHSGININDIEGLWVKDKNNIHKNKVRPLISDLDTLALPDRGIFDYSNLHSESQGRATIMVSRGCPYNCAYCCNLALRKATTDNPADYVRFKSVPTVMFELKDILKKYSFVKEFAFDDDILPLDINWFRQFAKEYKKEITMPYDCNLRPNLVNEEIVTLLKDSGCYQIRMGIESGSEHIRNKVMQRHISQQQLVKAFELCKAHGLRIFTFNMIGLPYENLSMTLDTVKLNSQLKSEINQVTIFYPYKNTRLYEICEQEGLIVKNKMVTHYAKDTILNFNLYRRNQLKFIQRYFRVLVKFYKFLERHPKSKAIFEKSLFSRVSSLTILPVFNLVFMVIWNNNMLSRLARSINRRFLRG